MSEQKPKISAQKNGPLTVKNVEKFTNSRHEPIETKKVMALCRCGASRKKPFCDGTHVAKGFIDEKEEGREKDKRISYKGKKIIIHDNRGICSHAAYCTDLLPAVFKIGAKVWIDADGAPAERVKEIINMCPSGALGYTEEDIEYLDADGAEPGIHICRDGPYEIHGSIEFEDFDPGDRASHEHYTLCRCGKSKNKPRCDGSHWYAAFKDDEALTTAAANRVWTVSHVMIETMVNWGIRHVFGIVGHSNSGIAEAVRVQEEKGHLTYIGIRHEGAAAFACSGYAKASGKPAACLSIAGPGATNLLSGLWDAKMDRVPVIALTGQVNTRFLGPGSFREIDLKAAFEAVTAFSKVVLPGSSHAELMCLAMKNAIVRRDVAHLIFPDEVQVQDAGVEAPAHPEGWLHDPEISPSKESIRLSMYRINTAKRPVIIVGYGARNSMKEIIALTEKLNAPVLTTFKAKGQISDFHPSGCGVLGRSGTPAAGWFMDNADLLIVFGASFSQHTGIDKTKPLIQVDFDPMALGKFHAVDTPVWGEAGITAAIFSENLKEKRLCIDCRQEIAERWALWRKEKARRREATSEKGLNSAAVFEILGNSVPENALFSLDVGSSAYSFGRYFECKDQRVILSGYLGSIGFSFPAAMGACMAQSERPVISISGDGGFAQYMAEFNTAVLYKMNLTHVLLNNGESGKISKEQRDANRPVRQTRLHNPNFAEYAQACGGFGVRVSRIEDLQQAIKDAVSYNGPALVEIITDPELI